MRFGNGLSHSRDSSLFIINRDELVSLRTVKPQPGERKEIELVPPPPPASTVTTEQSETTADAGSVSLMDKMEEENPVQSSMGDSDGIVFENSVEEEKKGEDENDSDSDEAVGHDEAAKEDRNLDDGDDKIDDNENHQSPPTSGTVSEMFQRLLNMSGASGSSRGRIALQSSNQIQAISPGSAHPGTDGAYTFSASALHGGRMICTLPDHPIHAGATAVVAVMIGTTLMVANAGDSRAVLCRDGAAFALSYDHKPQQESEMERIRKSGGFVNQFGRVNGNLNLSRSVGDLKYKQAHFLPPAEQMITAEPDVLRYVLKQEKLNKPCLSCEL